MLQVLNHSRWKLAYKTLPFVVGILLLKLTSHYFGFEFLSLNSLFTAVISANVFLIGFLLSGTLSDYKESERLPSEIASGIETLADEAVIIYKNKKSAEAKKFLGKLVEFNTLIVEWFYKREKTDVLRKKLFEFNGSFLVFESETQANFIVRLKQEQQNLRKTISRIHTIRETNFLGTGYAVAEIITSILMFGFIFIKITPFYESIFFIFFVSFTLIYMIFFIKDLDNPFEYHEQENAHDEVSLRPVLQSKQRLESYLENIDDSFLAK